MSIEKDSKWVKDGEVVEVFNCRKNHGGIYQDMIPCVWFLFDGDTHVLTESDFLEQYKPYEPVYEYKFVTDIHCGTKILDGYFTEDEIKEKYEVYQRIDFTKRERK